MKKIKTLSILLTLLCLQEVSADDKSGYYISGKMGVSIQQQQNRKLSVTDTNLDSGVSSTASLNLGGVDTSVFNGGLAIGYDFNTNNNIPIRLELEYMNRARATQSSEHYGIDFNLLVPNYGDNELKYQSKVKTQTAMVNMLWDVYQISDYQLYLALSAGAAFNEVSNSIPYRVFSNRGEINSSDSSIVNFAWGAGAGVSRKINNNFIIDLGYRFLDAGKLDANSSWYTAAFGINTGVTANTNVHVRYHDIDLSIRYLF